jgi:hypothetical protein
MRVNYVLNLTLFVSMTSAMISGFMISKVVLPVHPAADEYLNWHSIHKTSSRIALAAVGLHLCLNWDLMLAALRNFVRRRASRSSPPYARAAADCAGCDQDRCCDGHWSRTLR